MGVEKGKLPDDVPVDIFVDADVTVVVASEAYLKVAAMVHEHGMRLSNLPGRKGAFITVDRCIRRAIGILGNGVRVQAVLCIGVIVGLLGILN